MKKSLFFLAAASALLLTACSSESDVLQNTAQTQKAAVQDQAVGFDVYTPAATDVTRAGLVGTMTTSRMQRSENDGGGFGVYAFLIEDIDGDATATAYTPGTGSAAHVPNFMVNEKLLWNNTNLGWYYNPLKYWPNETNKDSQTTPAYMENDNQTTPPTYDNMHLDRLTFFAYAPYVPGDDAGTGITYITDKAGELGPGPTKATPKDPTVSYKLTTYDNDVNLDEGVDLLWGVAPAGGLSYTAVNGTTVTVDEGKPLIDMIKPDVNTSMKFLFNHALARFGFTVVAAVDQVSPGGELDPNTKITINKLKITGPFGTYGNLNLNNGTHANVANWTKIKETTITDASTNTGSPAELILQGQYKDDGTGALIADESSDADRAKNAIAPHLRWTKDHPTGLAEQTVVGVTTAKQDLLRPSTKWFNKLASTPAYNPGKKYVDATGAEINASYSFGATSQLYTVDGSGVYTQKASGSLTSPAYPKVYPDAAAPTDVLYVLTETGEYVDGTGVVAPNLPAGTKFYTRTGAGTPASPYVYANATPSWGSSTTHYYTVEGRKASCADIPFAYAAGTFYEAERNYIYVVPTNNLLALNSGISAGDANDLALRTIEVQIEYYITTEDSKLADLRAQTKNVITKKVVLPSLANGKSYNLNMVLGLTSVKIEAEVDDWKVINSQVDLPQNTAE